MFCSGANIMATNIACLVAEKVIEADEAGGRDHEFGLGVDFGAAGRHVLGGTQSLWDPLPTPLVRVAGGERLGVWMAGRTCKCSFTIPAISTACARKTG